MRVESQADTIYGLALAWELFHVDYDNTSIDQKNLVTEIHQPDGKPDVLQQLEHGVLSVVGGYESHGPAVSRHHRADAAAVRVPRRRRGHHRQRGVRSEEDAGSERAGRGTAGLARRSLGVHRRKPAARAAHGRVAGRRLARAQAATTTISPRARSRRRLPSTTSAKPQDELARVGAATELFIATRDPKYRKLLLDQRDAIAANIERVGWVVGRTLPLVQGRGLQQGDSRRGRGLSREGGRAREGNAVRRALQAGHLGRGLELSSASAGTSGCCTCRSRTCSRAPTRCRR